MRHKVTDVVYCRPDTHKQFYILSNALYSSIGQTKMCLGNKYFLSSTSTSSVIQVSVQVPVLGMQVQVPVQVPENCT